MVLLLSQHFSAKPIKVDDVRSNLWTKAIDEAAYTDEKAAYQAAILEQYKIYTEMADRSSARRALANAFFLSLNTATLTAAGALWTSKLFASWLLLLPLFLLLAQTGAWFWIVRSYRQLNTAKYIVVGMLEERLPASPYWRAEWKALGEGKNKALYWPLTHLEQWLPIIFAGLYILGFLFAVVLPF
ncbi:RipA family octameric membrane protein [Saccharomonospora azurea]|uniref:RipA family octameric membrane protein n=1 Tax=Saccharomonospora azurea TaxID=40988 RepID=UPI003D90E9AA